MRHCSMRWNAGSHWNARILGASVRQKSLPCLCIATIVIITIPIVIITIIIIIAVAIFTQDRRGFSHAEEGLFTLSPLALRSLEQALQQMEAEKERRSTR